MAFFKTLLGGSDSISSNKTGFSALPADIRAQLEQFAPEITANTLPSQGGATAFTPLPATGDENTAFDRLRTGLTPTSETLGADIALQDNPFQQSVIDKVNREAAGDFSILKQAQDQAGQFGSNRGITGASDIEERRLETIGNLEANQFNTALENALTKIPGLRSEDIAGLLGIGGFEREIERGTKQAPISALQAGTSLFSPFLQGGESFGKSSSSGGLLPALSGFVKPG